MGLHGIDAAIVMAFIAYAMASGWRARERAARGLDEYFLAGRSLSGWQAGLSMAATQFAADTPLLVTGLVATAGLFALWQLWVYALAFLLMGFVLAPSWRRAGVLTDAELAELRYGGRPAALLRVAKAVYFGTLFNCVVLAWVLFATRAIVEPFFVWDVWMPVAWYRPLEAAVTWIGVPMATRPDAPGVWTASTNNVISLVLILAVTLFYSTSGGLRTVVRTDTLQLAIAMLGTVLYAAWVVHGVGGLDALAEGIHARFAAGGPGGIRPDEILALTPSRARGASTAVLAVLALQWLIQLNADGTGYLAQRTMACRSDYDARLAAVVFTVVQILLRTLLWLPIALGLLLLFPPDLGLPLEVLRHEREASFVRGIAELLPVGVRGLMLTGMLAALASTIDTHLNWGASYWTNDLYARVVCRAWLRRTPTSRELVWVARLSSGLVLLAALAVMPRLSSIERTWRLTLLLGAGVGPMLVLRWLWWRVSGWGELACLASSLVVALPLLEAPIGDAARLLVMAGVATTVGVGVSYAMPETAEQLQTFFIRAVPPGWWGPVAASLGVDRALGVRRLVRGLVATIAAAGSVLALLVGAATWMCGSPAPTWWPGSATTWGGALLASGVLLVPLWVRVGFAPVSAVTRADGDPA